jgi:hypothetical protein
MLEAKSYNNVRQTLAVGNGIFAAVALISAYLFVLGPIHKQELEALLQGLKLNPVISPFATLAILGGIWGYLTTFMVSLHDRLYEPHLVSWRASYDSDFILRSLCFPYSEKLSPRLFETAFSDSNVRHRLMQRLFYKFVGDSKSAHEELRERFYTLIRNYWLLVLAEIYCIAFFIFAALYCSFTSQATRPYPVLLASILGSVLLRVWSNRYPAKIRPITVEQIRSVHSEHRAEFEKELTAVIGDFNFQR